MQKDGTTIVNTVHLILNVKYSFLFLKIVILKLLIVGQKWSEKWTHIERKKDREKGRKEQRETEKWERKIDSKKEKQRY